MGTREAGISCKGEFKGKVAIVGTPGECGLQADGADGRRP